jgi:3-oxoadipate enol-lactonase
VRCPVLIVAGAQDQGTPVAMSEAMAQRLPQARLEVLPVAHLGAAVEQPEAFVQLLRPFLAAITPAAGLPGGAG